MEENTSGLKFARVIAVAHIIVGVFLFVLGLTDRLHGDSWTGKLGFGIWIGLWVGILFLSIFSAYIRAKNKNRRAKPCACRSVQLYLAIVDSFSDYPYGL